MLVWSSILCFAATPAKATANVEERSPRPVTVLDAVQMRELSNWKMARKNNSIHGIATFSPDGKRFVILVKKGDSEHNRIEYSMLMYGSRDAMNSPMPDVLVSQSSSSNRPGIQAVQWLDNQTIAFLGENPGEEQQLYVVNCLSHNRRQLTHHSTSLVSYAMDKRRGRFFFTAETRRKSLVSEQSRRSGIVISSQLLSDLIAIDGSTQSAWWDGLDLYSQASRTNQEVKIDTRGAVQGPSPMWVSPDGRYIVLNTALKDNPPEKWNDYKYGNTLLKQEVRTKYAKGAPRALLQLEVVDVESGTTQAVIDAPTGSAQVDIVWAPDSHSIVVSRTFLPVDGVDASLRATRYEKRYVAQIFIPGGDIIPITDDDLELNRWDYQSGRILFEQQTAMRQIEPIATSVVYERVDGKWQEFPYENRNCTTVLRLKSGWKRV